MVAGRVGDLFQGVTSERLGYPHLFDDVRPGMVVLVVAVMVYDKL